MKKLLVLAVVGLAIVACNKAETNVVSTSDTVTVATQDSVDIVKDTVVTVDTLSK